MPTYKAQPEDFGFTQEQGEALYHAYVVEEMTIPQAVKAVRARLECKIPDRQASAFLRTNGWIRPQSYYAKRSPFAGYVRAHAEEAKAVVRNRGDWVD